MVSGGGMWQEGSIKIGEDIFHYWIKQYGGDLYTELKAEGSAN
jgi:hypothetical protein